MSISARSVLSLVGAAGALLTCFMIVLNVAHVGTDAKQKVAQQNPVVPPVSVGRSETAESPPLEHSELIVETTPVEPAPIKTVETAAMEKIEAPLIADSVSLSPNSLPVAIPETPAPPSPAIVGVWVPDAGSCSVRNFRGGLLPTIINLDGAWAGETFCVFSNQKQTETGWKVTANCSNSREQWSTQVRLTVKGDRLRWTSKRGSQDYTRCSPDFLLAKAQ